MSHIFQFIHFQNKHIFTIYFNISMDAIAFGPTENR